MNKVPETADDLNAWINVHFQACDGPARAWAEFNFRVWFGGKDDDDAHRHRHRIVFAAICFRGEEDACVKAMALWLRSLITAESYEDGNEPVFIRKRFSYEKDNRELFGRIAFWDPEKQQKLISFPCYKPEGALPRKAQEPDQAFNLYI